MTKKIALLPALLACLLFVACSKEKSLDSTDPGNHGGNNANSELIGDWKFVQLHLVGQSVLEVSGAGMPDMKTITHIEYYTKDNTGTVTFTANKMITTGVAYTVDTVQRSEMFMDGIPVSDMEMPFTFALPPGNSTSDYKLIGTDSLYSATGFTDLGGLGAMPQVPTIPVGVKFSIVNDTLTLRMPVNVQTTVPDPGGGAATGILKANSVGTITLVRQ